MALIRILFLFFNPRIIIIGNGENDRANNTCSIQFLKRKKNKKRNGCWTKGKMEEWKEEKKMESKDS